MKVNTKADAAKGCTENELDIESIDLKSAAAGIIAHDLNNFLVAIIGNISLAKTELEPGSSPYRRLDQAEKAYEGLRDYSIKLTNFFRAKESTFKRIDSISLLLRSSAMAAMQGMMGLCEFEIDEDLHPVKIDPVLIKDAFANIIKNAAKAIQNNGRINIRAENTVVSENSGLPLDAGKYIRIAFKDNGPGIPPERLEGIFVPTFKVNNGFGLPLSYYIIKKHCGHIVLDSIEKQGTKVTVYIPAKEGGKE